MAAAVAVAMAWRGRASRGLGRSGLQWHTPGRQCRAVPFCTQSPRCSTSPKCACDGEDRRQPLGRQNETRLSGLLTDAFALAQLTATTAEKFPFPSFCHLLSPSGDDEKYGNEFVPSAACPNQVAQRWRVPPYPLWFASTILNGCGAICDRL